MTALRLARSELQRMTSGLLPRLAIIALTLVPLLYGALYLYANWDPYGKLDGVKAALVVADEGADTDDGRLDVGSSVEEDLLRDGTFDWQVVDSTDAADRGVAEGTYDFALTIPAGFSAALASPADLAAAHQATLHVTTNDANNYLLSSIVDKLAGTVHDTVAAQVSEETANQLITGFNTVHDQLQTAAEGASSLAEGAGTAGEGAANLSTGLTTLREGADALASGEQTLVDGTATLSSGAAALSTGAGSVATGATTLATGAGELSTGAATLSTGAGGLSTGLSTLAESTAGLPEQTRQLADAAAAVAAGTGEINTLVSGSAAGMQQGLADAVARLVASGVLTTDQAASVAAELSAVPQGAAADLTQLQALTDAAAQVSAGASTLADASGALATGVSNAAAGASTVATGASDLATGASDLATGATTLSTGASDLATGASNLATGASNLATGQGSALTAAGELAKGAAAAETGAAGLAEGIGTVTGGASDLAVKLQEGAGAVPNPDNAERANASAVIADPLSVSTVKQTDAGSYGAGLAPYFLALALWVGVFMLAQAMRPVSPRALASNAAAWKIAAGGWLPFLGVALVQASVLYAVVLFGLGLDPAHPVLAWGMLLLASVAFSALIQGLVALLGSVGKYVVLILLVLQLASAGGTFPWETTPGPLHLAHSVLPMGHLVAGLRQLLYGGDLGQALPVAAALAGYTAAGLVLATLGARRHKLWTLKTLQPEIQI